VVNEQQQQQQTFNNPSEKTSLQKMDDSALLYALCIRKEWDNVRRLLPKATRKQLFFKDTKSENMGVFCTAVRQNAPCDIVNDLLAKGLDVNILNNDGASGLCYAVVENVDTELIKLLLEKGANVNLADKYGVAPLMIAMEKSVKPAIVQLLLRYGADVHQMGENNLTPLHVACQFNTSVPLVKLLLTHGADPNKRSKNGGAALHSAAISRASPSLFEVLLIHGADPNLRTNDGATPLHFAVDNGCSVESVTLLLEYGANVLVKAGTHSLTALEVAIMRNNTHLIPILTNPPPPTKMKVGVTKRVMNEKCSYCLKDPAHGERLLKCKGCLMVSYCDAKCAKSDWSVHKANCRVASTKSASEDDSLDNDKIQSSTATTTTQQ
jgi:ankyrin repeat protein